MTDDVDDTEEKGVWLETSFSTEYQLLDASEMADAVTRVTNHRTSDRLGLPPPFVDMPSDIETYREMEEIPAYALKMWNSIDRKLDTLLRFASGETNRLENCESGIVTKISQDGLNLKCAAKAKTGDSFLIRLVPPTYPAFTIDVIGKAKSITEDDTQKIIHLEFYALNKDDRELLISYIFKLQRSILRSQSEND